VKIIDSLNKLELDNKKIFLIILGVVVVLYVDYALILKAQISGVKSLNSKVLKIKTDILTLNKDLANISKIESQPAIVVEKGKRVISEKEMALLLEDISNIANKNNVRLMLIKPSREQEKKEKKAKEEKKPKAEKKQKEEKKETKAPSFTVYNIELDLSCSYHSLGMFINDLENGEMFVAVKSLKVMPEKDNYLWHKINLVLKTYVKK